ncbi:sugar ABC transporter permease [Streptomyces angustmyceticus]|uniref:ABC transporter permease n=2 Tax=Streptomyces angustmyceticus TaxID=285578 RepID=A0A5J4L2P2_9ACTN|nr:sugar ABC transporter permease [Streptomyces angustmyceticus]GES28637.1 ABC transporter permease [Streptomyces angustmyceticus]
MNAMTSSAPASRRPAAEPAGPPPVRPRRGDGPGRVSRRRRARTGWLFASPALLIISAVTVFPVLFSVLLSFAEVRLEYGGFSIRSLTGDHYAAVLSSPEWRQALLFTFGFTVVTVLLELVLGTAAALVLERLGAARGWVLAVLLLPWALINVVAAQLWGYLFNGTYGGLTWLFEQLLGHQPDILGQPASAMGAMVVVDVWKTTPFVAIVVLAGLMLIPGDVYEAAEIDGAGTWTTFWKVTLPQLRPIMAIAVLFRILQAFGIFDLPFVLTQGGPGTATESLAILGYKTLFQNLAIGRGAAVATTTAVIVISCCLLFLRVFKAQADEGGRA